MKKIIFAIAILLCSIQLFAQVNSYSLAPWMLNYLGGNAWVYGGNYFRADGKIGTKNAFAVRFITDNTERFTILSGGNIGIGNTNPTFKFDVGGYIRTTQQQGFISEATGYSQRWLFGSDAGNFKFSLNGLGAAWTIDKTTLFTGFGTETPDRRLHSEQTGTQPNDVVISTRITAIYSATTQAGFGVGQEFEAEAADGNNDVIATVQAVFSDVTAGSEDADLQLKTIAAGVMTNRISIGSNIATGTVNDLTLAGANNTIISGGASTSVTSAGSTTVTGTATLSAGTANNSISFNESTDIATLKTSATTRMTVSATGIFNLTLPTYADDVAAGLGGLVTGDLYKTATGEVRIKI